MQKIRVSNIGIVQLRRLTEELCSLM